MTFENCVFQNGDQLSRWMIHGEYGSVTVDQCKFQNCDNGVGVVTEASSAFTPTEISFRVQNSVFDGIADIGAVHFSIGPISVPRSRTMYLKTAGSGLAESEVMKLHIPDR